MAATQLMGNNLPTQLTTTGFADFFGLPKSVTFKTVVIGSTSRHRDIYLSTSSSLFSKFGV